MNNTAFETDGVRKKSTLGHVFGDGMIEEIILILLMISVWVHYIASGVMLVLLLMAVLIIPRTRKAVLGESKLFLLGVVISVFSLLVSAIAVNYIGMAISFGVFVIVTLGCFSKSVMTHRRFKMLMFVGCIGSVVSVAVAFYQKSVVEERLYRSSALAFNPNYYGMLISMTMLVCVYGILDADRAEGSVKRRVICNKLFFLAVLILNCYSLIVLCRSRSALLGFMACTVIYLVMSGRYAFGILGICLAVSVIALGWFFPEVMVWNNSILESFLGRENIWENAMSAFRESPYSMLIGRGPMTYYHIKDIKGFVDDAPHAHNILFDTLLNVGIIGTVFYAVLVIYLIREIFKARREGNTEAFALGTVFMLVVVVQGISDVTIVWHQCTVLFFFVLALSGKERRKISGEMK